MLLCSHTDVPLDEGLKRSASGPPDRAKSPVQQTLHSGHRDCNVSEAGREEDRFQRAACRVWLVAPRRASQSQGESPFPERRQASEVLGSNGKRASARRDSAAAGLGHLRFDPPKLVHHR